MKRVKVKHKFYGYITTGSNERKSGMANQRKQIKNIFSDETIEYYKDFDVPNDSGFENRPALCEILKKIRRIDYLLVAEKDRLNEDNFLGCWLEKESKIKGFETGPEPDLSIVTYRYLPKSGDANGFNKRLLDSVLEDGRVFMSSTMIAGNFTLRLAVLNFRTHRDTIDYLLELLQRKANELDDN